ncbi:MAG TPA: shikimate dehydrogenase [Porphyromonadaceae bacterium]|nr:shikimate dehydrogenase [Porphyromonadaceae bacterium]
MDKYGLIGNPVDHSFSADYFNTKFAENGIDARYDAYQLNDIDKLVNLLNDNPDLIGLNVTSPFKQQVMKYVDVLSPDAEAVQAVNTVYIRRNSTSANHGCILNGVTVFGHNTDIEGFRTLVTPYLETYANPRALILGSGGAARAVAAALVQLKVDYRMVSRSPQSDAVLSYSDIDDNLMSNIDFIIDATPLGMGTLSDEKPPLDYSLISGKHTCIDLVYNPAETLFMRECAARGARVCNGLRMLIGQAEASWRFWCDMYRHER